MSWHGNSILVLTHYCTPVVCYCWWNCTSTRVEKYLEILGGGMWGEWGLGKGETSAGAMPYSPPFKAAILSKETHFCHQETKYNSRRYSGTTWRLATLSHIGQWSSAPLPSMLCWYSAPNNKKKKKNGPALTGFHPAFQGFSPSLEGLLSLSPVMHQHHWINTRISYWKFQNTQLPFPSLKPCLCISHCLAFGHHKDILLPWAILEQ